jgi:hypothetical protein
MYYTLFSPNVIYNKKIKEVVWNERNWRWETSGLGSMRRSPVRGFGSLTCARGTKEPRSKGERKEGIGEPEQVATAVTRVGERRRGVRAEATKEIKG